MKKFITIAIFAFVLLTNFIVDITDNNVAPLSETYFAKVDDKDFHIVKNGEWHKIDLIGVNLSSSKPGYFPSEHKVTEEEYLRYIKYIYDMGANCIKIPHLIGHEFYNALNKFNEDKDNPIYIIQGIYFDEESLKDGYDPQAINIESLYKEEIKRVVDSVHGNALNVKNVDLSNRYKADVSKYLIGYTLGIEFSASDIIYTEIMNEEESYKGKYLYTSQGSSSFESYLAMLGDFLANYEMTEYDELKIIGFSGSSPYNILNINDKETKNNHELSNEVVIENNKDKLIENGVNNDLNKNVKDYINVENIKSKNSFKTGTFVSYNVYPSFSNIREYQENIQNYFERINNYHKIPVVIGEFGLPSSRTVADFDNANKKGYITEEEQGRALISIYNAIKKSGCAGSFIFEFLDGWHNSSFNTKDSKILDRSPYWSDAQTYGQNFGLMAFDPGKEKSVCYPDNTTDEWDKDDIVSKNENYSLSMKSDEKYLYFMIMSKDDLNLNTQDIFIDLDITPKSGSNISSQYSLEFERPIDFIINIKDSKNSSILVHEYYNRFNFYENKSENLKRPDLINHTKDMDEFSPIYIETRPKMYVESLNEFAEKQIQETGKLIHGNTNPNKKDFYSVADYFVGNNYVEIRIPYGLLNFMDPSTKAIQDDFYEVLDTIPLSIKNINVGLTIKEYGKNTNRLNSASYDLDGWMMPIYHERLKQSYFIVRDELTKYSNDK